MYRAHQSHYFRPIGPSSIPCRHCSVRNIEGWLPPPDPTKPHHLRYTPFKIVRLLMCGYHNEARMVSIVAICSPKLKIRISEVVSGVDCIAVNDVNIVIIAISKQYAGCRNKREKWGGKVDIRRDTVQ